MGLIVPRGSPSLVNRREEHQDENARGANSGVMRPAPSRIHPQIRGLDFTSAPQIYPPTKGRAFH